MTTVNSVCGLISMLSTSHHNTRRLYAGEIAVELGRRSSTLLIEFVG